MVPTSTNGRHGWYCRGAAADVLTEVVSKRMEAVPKLTLIQQLGVVPVRKRGRNLTSAVGWRCAVRQPRVTSAIPVSNLVE